MTALDRSWMEEGSRSYYRFDQSYRRTGKSRSCCRGNNIFEWFCSAAQPSEKDELVSGNVEAGAMVKCTEMLHSVVRQGLATEFKRLAGKVPPCLGSAKVMAATALETQLRTLKKLREGSEFTPEVAALLSFRKVRCPTPHSLLPNLYHCSHSPPSCVW